MSNHNFKVLVVEDEVNISDYITSVFTAIDDRVEVTIAGSRDQAFDILNDSNQFFDFITLDLKIPVDTDSFEKSPQHGLAVLGRCTVMAKGTPLSYAEETVQLNLVN